MYPAVQTAPLSAGDSSQRLYGKADGSAASTPAVSAQPQPTNNPFAGNLDYYKEAAETSAFLDGLGAIGL